ncbi:MarR family transcriptional regulator [Paenibacillus sp. FSL R7-0297]|uniref:MarR family transcriptional regulator n=1 Tax=unclassified Paenibacillus TaxID=185978 RepID=UPI0004F6E085|nr:MarR family transcriptional regulator [Paenibacillus sp. FSL R5-0912]AIQ40379.1 MarR family transcriptional regulator [Paenibacillus sp. FSL R5-0912]
MNSSEGLKRLLYGRLLHLTHLNEQLFASELDAFADLTRQYGLTFTSNSLTSIHVIDCIGNHEPINSTSIAEKMNLSKASITKISGKLLQEGCIKRSRMNDNRKEVYFSLTPKGRQLFVVHAEMHENFEQSFIQGLNTFSEAELQASLKFIQTVISHSDTMIKNDENS